MSSVVISNPIPTLIGPSLLASDLSNLSNEANRVLNAGADFLHLDVMDGHFVPNITFGAPVISCLRENVPKDAILDVHLMVTNPGQWVEDMSCAGANIFTFHIETFDEESKIIELINKIKNSGMKVGIAIKPNTSHEKLIPFLSLLDQVLVMTVEPGFGGQKFMEILKVVALRKLVPHMNIEVDGGLGPDTISKATEAGANMIVAGSSIFKGEPKDNILLLRKMVEKNLL